MAPRKSLKRILIICALTVSFIQSGLAFNRTTQDYSGGPTVPAVVADREEPQQVQAVDAITAWNKRAAALSVLPASALSPVAQTRVMAIVQVAVHDAVNGITGKYETYLRSSAAPLNASPEAAAIAASHQTLRALFPGQADSLDIFFTESLAAQGLSAADPGVEFGRASASAILALRTNDRSSQAQFNYTAPDAGFPGVWVHTTSAPALLPGWGEVTPFVLKSGSQFRPDPPPSLRSKRYAKDYNEVKQLGALNGSSRTSEQTQIATFWRASPTTIWNDVLNQAIAAHDLDLSATARVFALFYLAASDASVACWEAKYFYNFWRPQPAIRRGAEDDNDDTEAAGTWEPLVATPPHPDYPSGHCANSNAMATILELIFGDDPGVPISVTISGITRQWHTFSEAVDEVIDARIYSGIHFRTADEQGSRLGRKIARFVSNHALKRCPKGGCS